MKPLFEAREVSKAFVLSHGLFGYGRREVRALHRVNLSLSEGQSLGLVGESGSGKTTLARLAAGLEMPSQGRLLLAGAEYPQAPSARRRLLAQHMAMVFQDPRSSLNPHKTAQQLLSAPLLARHGWSARQRRERVREVLDLVELPSKTQLAYPHELSGGQAQRLAIARALAPRPRLLVLDEAVSSLDVSIQARLLRLLHKLRQELNLSYLFIAHDLGVVEVLCDQIAVMYFGSIVERGRTRDILDNPKHPYTRALLSAVPTLGKKARRLALMGEPPSPLRPPPGCSFQSRCYRAEARCAKEEPTLAAGRVNHPCACFFAHDSEPGKALSG